MSLQPLPLPSLHGRGLAGPCRLRHGSSMPGRFVGIFASAPSRMPSAHSCLRLQAGTKTYSQRKTAGKPAGAFSLRCSSRASSVASTRVQSVEQHGTSGERGVSEGGKDEAPSTLSSSSSLVWFKHDLRIHDHAALHALASAVDATAIPLFVFDPVILRSKLNSYICMKSFTLFRCICTCCCASSRSSAYHMPVQL